MRTDPWKAALCPHCKAKVLSAKSDLAKLGIVYLDLASVAHVYELKDSSEEPIAIPPRPVEVYVEHRCVCPRFDADLQQKEAPPSEVKEEIPL